MPSACSNSTSGGSTPELSMVNMKWSFFLRYCMHAATASSSSSARTFSRCCWWSRAACTRSWPPSRVNRPGAAASSRSATSAGGSLSSTTSGSSLYHAVATGENLAWSLPMPLTACASSVMDCPGRSLASRMSSCTARGFSASVNMWPCPAANLHPVSSGISLPPRSHRSSLDSTLSFSMLPSLSRLHVTSSLNTSVFFSPGASSATLGSSLAGSTRSGTMPSR
mmetsp:Transcript_35311/g.89378  ORF Transcript_35311/g.89378 Transcript_35311/m.89378 type:complete len:224 (+) Transcript_35311:454-1125(+)